ncbi:MAG: histidinol-phosphate transaminase [Anaerovoracaceae bacterium]|jgi:histidinol-phosphate aminotransferase
MNPYFTALAQGLEPYVPGEQPKDKKYIKLNTNENPYPASEKVKNEIRSAMDDLRLYPDPEAMDLRRTIAAYYNEKILNIKTGKALNIVDGERPKTLTEKNVFVGNGSDEVLAFAFPAFFTGKKIAYPDITYSFYPVYANLFQAEITEIPLKEDFSIEITDYLALDKNYSGILIPNPNAPTGRCLPLSEIEKMLRANPDKVILMDEAYIDFGGETAVSLVGRYENLLVVQTFSKSRSLAGLRVGFAIGSEALIEGLNRIKNSFNSYTIDRLAMAGAKAAIEDDTYFEENKNKIIRTRERVAENLKEMKFSVIPSRANFLFITHKEIKAEEIFLKLREKGVLVRYFNKPLINNYLRVSIGTDEEMDVFLNVLSQIL